MNVHCRRCWDRHHPSPLLDGLGTASPRWNRIVGRGMTEAAAFPESVAPEQYFPTIGELVTNTNTVAPNVTVKVVADEFFHDAQLEAVALVESDRPVGLVTRTKFLFTV